jgi:molybdopterin-guanine dinucleotide biosynthesis protein
MTLSQYELNFAKMDLAISDVMSILESSLPDSVKYNMLIINGFSEEDASKLVPNGDKSPAQVNTNSLDVNKTTTTPEAMEDVNTTPPVNDNLKGLSAQENADIYRIIRDFNKGKLPEAMALIRLGAYGIDAESAKEILGL